MRALFLLITGLWLVCAAPAAAQDDPGAGRRLELAERYLELTSGTNLDKLLTRQIEEAYAKAEMPEDQRAWLTDNMSAALAIAIDATMADLRDDVAELFTEAELEAGIAFYETPLGRSIADKTQELSMQTQEAMMPHLMTAMTNLGEKYCARFTCDAAAGGLAGKFDQ